MASIARVYVNSVEVGALPASQYNEICEDIQKDWRFYVLQAFNIIKVTIRLSGFAFRYVPVLYFLLLILGLFWMTAAEWQQVVDAVRVMSVDEWVLYGRRMVLFGWVFNLFVFVPVMVCSGGPESFGYVDQRGAAINKALCSILEVPTEGCLTVTVVDESAVADE